MRTAGGTRQNSHIMKIEMFALDAEALAGPRALQNFDRLQGAAEARLLRNLQRVEFLVAVAHPDAEAEAAAREHVDHRGVLGEAQRMIERGEQDVSAELQAGGARGDRGQHRHDGREITVVDEVMLGEPNGMEAGGLDEFYLAEHLGVK